MFSNGYEKRLALVCLRLVIVANVLTFDSDPSHIKQVEYDPPLSPPLPLSPHYVSKVLGKKVRTIR